MSKPIAIYYEQPHWFKPLFAELDRLLPSLRFFQAVVLVGIDVLKPDLPIHLDRVCHADSSYCVSRNLADLELVLIAGWMLPIAY